MSESDELMTTWDYRVIHSRQNDEDVYEIREVYFDSTGKMQAKTADAVPAFGNTLEELTRDLIWQLDACTKPIIELDDIPEEGAEPLIPPGVGSGTR